MFGLALAASALFGTGTGKVQAAGENPYNAFNWYYVTDGTTISKKYSKTHLHSKSVSTGDSVSRGEEVAVSGNTGTDTTGPHLHIDVNKEGEFDGKYITYSNTINPIFFWPRYFKGPTFAPNESTSESYENEYHESEDELLHNNV